MGILSGLILAGIGLFTIVFGWIQFRTGKASGNWPSTKGKVVLTEVKESSSTDEDGSTSRRYSPRVEYAYTVSGRKYTSDQVAIGARWQYSSQAKARAKLAYRSGQQVDVYYNPQKPDQALLEPGVTGGARGTLIIGIVFMIAAAVVLVYSLQGIMAQ
jgi:hypothetical protein